MKASYEPRRKTFGLETKALADQRQVRVICSTDQVDRSGDVVVQGGISVSNFAKTQTVLWNHDQDHPIARCIEIGVKSGRLEALVEFPEPGVSAKSDEVYGLIKAGIINAASIGFVPLEAEPLNGKNRAAGLRFDESELLEFSFVSVPANPGALITQRSLKSVRKAAPPMTLKGLCGVASLAWLLDELGYQTDRAAAEALAEGDNSQVPAMLAAAMNQLGQALIAMTQEEVAELLGSGGEDAEEDFGGEDDDETGDVGPMEMMSLPVPLRKWLQPRHKAAPPPPPQDAAWQARIAALTQS